jgi:hypothetical protein
MVADPTARDHVIENIAFSVVNSVEAVVNPPAFVLTRLGEVNVARRRPTIMARRLSQFSELVPGKRKLKARIQRAFSIGMIEDLIESGQTTIRVGDVPVSAGFGFAGFEIPDRSFRNCPTTTAGLDNRNVAPSRSLAHPDEFEHSELTEGFAYGLLCNPTLNLSKSHSCSIAHLLGAILKT